MDQELNNKEYDREYLKIEEQLRAVSPTPTTISASACVAALP